MTLESDRMNNLVLSKDDFDKEIKVVMEERRWRTEDRAQSLVMEQLNAAAFIASPYRAPVVGWMNDLEAMTVEDAREWYERWYAPNNALLIVAGQYKLNPWTKEIYAFPDKGGIVPVVGVDGWSRIINSNPQFDGMDFEQDADSCTCTIYRKDRAHPIRVTEYLSECKRGTGPWGSHPRRMLRHKSMIQCARLAFGYSGIYDQDSGGFGTSPKFPMPINLSWLIEQGATGNPEALEPLELLSTAASWLVRLQSAVALAELAAAVPAHRERVRAVLARMERSSEGLTGRMVLADRMAVLDALLDTERWPAAGAVASLYFSPGTPWTRQ